MPLSTQRYRELVAALVERGAPSTPAIIDAFRTIDRSDFLPPSLRERSHENVALPIGFGQMTTEPFILGFMLELLEPQPGQNVLDVGAGSGWQTALLAHIVGERGRVTAIEVLPELKAFCEENLAKYHYQNVRVLQGDGSAGWPDGAPYDRIFVSAAVPGDAPKAMIEQLRVGGRLLLPLERNRAQVLTLVERIGEHEIRERGFHGFSFPRMTHSSKQTV